MIDIKNLTKKFGNHVSIDNMSCTFDIGESIALMGANGAGKTTLIRCILGLYHPTSGEILVDGLNPLKKRTNVLKKISFVPQLPPPIRLSLAELIRYVSVNSRIEEDFIIDYTKKMKLDIDANLHKSFFALSGGMKQKLLIAIALAKQSEILIFDEPTANLDPKAREDFYELLSENTQNKILLFVTHRLEEVERLVNREVYMDMGKVISDTRI